MMDIGITLLSGPAPKRNAPRVLSNVQNIKSVIQLQAMPTKSDTRCPSCTTWCVFSILTVCLAAGQAWVGGGKLPGTDRFANTVYRFIFPYRFHKGDGVGSSFIQATDFDPQSLRRVAGGYLAALFEGLGPVSLFFSLFFFPLSFHACYLVLLLANLCLLLFS